MEPHDVEREEQRAEAARVISVVAKPSHVPGEWDLVVDFDNWISPWEAHALLRAGTQSLEASHPYIAPMEDEGE